MEPRSAPGEGPEQARPAPRRRECAWLLALALIYSLCRPSAGAAGTIRGVVTAPGPRGSAGAVVYVDAIPGKSFPPGPEVIVDQHRLTFLPHVLTVVTGTPVVFLNSDDVWHNIFSVSETKRFNLGTNARGTRRHLVFDRPGVVELLCNVHAEMSAFIIVAGTPYVASVGPDGAYVLEGVPAGPCTVAVWHEGHRSERREVKVTEEGPTRVNFELRR